LTETRGRNAVQLVDDGEFTNGSADLDDSQRRSLRDDNPDLVPVTASQLRDDLPEAFQPQMLAVLETQCRNFFRWADTRHR
jgi:hypothetical protein